VPEIREFMQNGRVYTLEMRDRFSDYGTVGVCIVSQSDPEAEIDSLLLSCRAFGRRVEDTFVAVVLSDLAEAGTRRVSATWLETPKNGMVRDFFSRHAFTVLHDSDSVRSFERSLAPGAIASSPPEHSVLKDWT